MLILAAVGSSPYLSSVGGGGVNCSGEVQQNVPLLLLLSKSAQFGENLEPPSKKN